MGRVIVWDEAVWGREGHRFGNGAGEY